MAGAGSETEAVLEAADQPKSVTKFKKVANTDLKIQNTCFKKQHKLRESNGNARNYDQFSFFPIMHHVHAALLIHFR